jgi:hypothetical protein
MRFVAWLAPQGKVKPATGRLAAALPVVCKVASFTIWHWLFRRRLYRRSKWLVLTEANESLGKKRTFNGSSSVTQGKTRIVQIARAWIGES